MGTSHANIFLLATISYIVNCIGFNRLHNRFRYHTTTGVIGFQSYHFIFLNWISIIFNANTLDTLLYSSIKISSSEHYIIMDAWLRGDEVVSIIQYFVNDIHPNIPRCCHNVWIQNYLNFTWDSRNQKKYIKDYFNLQWWSPLV